MKVKILDTEIQRVELSFVDQKLNLNLLKELN